MNEAYTAAELVAFEISGQPTSEFRMRKRALRESWPSRPRAGRGGGREYFFSGLPLNIQVAILSRSGGQQPLTPAHLPVSEGRSITPSPVTSTGRPLSTEGVSPVVAPPFAAAGALSSSVGAKDFSPLHSPRPPTTNPDPPDPDARSQRLWRWAIGRTQAMRAEGERRASYGHLKAAFTAVAKEREVSAGTLRGWWYSADGRERITEYPRSDWAAALIPGWGRTGGYELAACHGTAWEWIKSAWLDRRQPSISELEPIPIGDNRGLQMRTDKLTDGCNS